MDLIAITLVYASLFFIFVLNKAFLFKIYIIYFFWIFNKYIERNPSPYVYPLVITTLSFVTASFFNISIYFEAS